MAALFYTIILSLLFSCSMKNDDKRESYSYYEFCEMTGQKLSQLDENASNSIVKLLKLNHINTLNFTSKSHTIRLKESNKIIKYEDRNKSAKYHRYMFKFDLLGEKDDEYILIFSSVGPVSGQMFIYDKYLKLLKKIDIGHVKEIHFIKNLKGKDLLRLKMFSYAGTNTEHYYWKNISKNSLIQTDNE